MFKLVSKVAAAGTLALAAIAPLALSTAARAESREPAARIAYGDLNLRTAAGAGELESRIQSEGARLCAAIDRTDTGTRIRMNQATCMNLVRADVLAQMPRQDRAAVLAAANVNSTVVAGR